MGTVGRLLLPRFRGVHASGTAVSYKEAEVKLRSQKEKAEVLLSLHTNGKLLVLPNVWNPIGARILEKKGFPAVATASAAISASLGYQDGEKIKRATAIDLIGRIARIVDVPVTADIETGYAESLSELEVTAQQVVESGAVGVNIEDGLEWEGGLRAIEDQCQRISAFRKFAERCGVHLVINARTDSFVSSSFTTKEEAMEEAVARAKAFAEAGADCFYPIGPGDEITVRLLRDRIKSPINILVSPTAAPLDIMREIGVNRVSFGPYLFRSCTRKFADIVDGLLTAGDYFSFSDMMSRAEIGEYLLTGHE
ncbi:MAG: isocitrate lyase/phosphoenolpyruvate mutase family protein [Acidobacteria bacterium]|nr:MAG: isocitrate lyase/phosphoenolpyruvate mutase family protein [Acidobacteriota bacterium]